MPFPIDDLNAIVKDVQEGVAIVGDIIQHAKNIFSWLGVSFPMFASKTGVQAACPCELDDACKKVKAFCEENKTKSEHMAASAIDPSTLSAILQLIMTLIQRWLNPPVGAPKAA